MFLKFRNGKGNSSRSIVPSRPYCSPMNFCDMANSILDHYILIMVIGMFASGSKLGIFDMTCGYPGEGPSIQAKPNKLFLCTQLCVFFSRWVLTSCCLLGIKWVSLLATFVGCLGKKCLKVGHTYKGTTYAINNCRWIQPVHLLSLFSENFGNSTAMGASDTRTDGRFPDEFEWDMDEILFLLSAWLICAMFSCACHK